ncbi:hypothetical protein VF14_24035 [Nostoc linckia z18]|uniref:Uncharacterized protein n=2 Tax=Nostoc linckia TaxID=92942 RepID=A0A9Q6EJJ9_NOSLI|nr:hypothetical protein [Nostoc linckia]PHK39986.1 hypothetical protein VF12_12305 [Nostoc linckia z15]PHK44006.1 hypothetical protein VF13_24150 [Nostoc linckia z16]PHJ56862.1 hypothetical protein VF02_31750 [Nostoc linckia z1]PHJ58752.1 hypothetical protein VF05_33340 [Nostoc linckia z3]PHJ62560.1 hypothetical protein VF03_31240 [Nostoc linckia z2]
MGNSESKTVIYEQDGRTYTGTYKLERGIITVSFDLQDKTTQLGNMPEELLARLLMSELVNEHLRKNK